MQEVSTANLSLRVRLTTHAGDDTPFVGIDTSVQVGAAPEEEVMLSTMYLDKEEAEGLWRRLGEILVEWPAEKHQRRWDKQTGEPVSKEAFAAETGKIIGNVIEKAASEETFKPVEPAGHGSVSKEAP